jgi:hypothetical protein
MTPLTLCARSGDLHGINLKPVQATTDRGIVFAEPPSFRLVRDLKDSQTERSIRRHHGPIEKQFAPVKVLPEISTMPFHQGPLFAGHVLGKARPGRNQCEVVMRFVHRRNIILQTRVPPPPGEERRNLGYCFGLSRCHAAGITDKQLSQERKFSLFLLAVSLSITVPPEAAQAAIAPGAGAGLSTPERSPA